MFLDQAQDPVEVMAVAGYGNANLLTADLTAPVVARMLAARSSMTTSHPA